MSNPLRAEFDSALRRLGAAWCGAGRAAARLLPQSCALCTVRCAGLLCDDCVNALPPLPPACPVCACPCPGGVTCGACLAHPPAFAATVAACAYAFPLDRLVQALKYAHRLALAQPLADLLAAAARRRAPGTPLPQALVPLPLAPARMRERGFNQAIEIARVLARRTGLPLARGLVRTRHSGAQAALPWSERRRNVRGAFGCTASFAGQHVALVDDVMTTGATLDAAATALRRAGAARVDAWVVARTPPPR